MSHSAVCSLNGRYRWCLSGTPIHNKLDDYGALLSFMKVAPFETARFFDYWITSLIKIQDPKGFKRLKKIVAATSLRRTKTSVESELHLQPRTDLLHDVKLSESEQSVYDFFKTRAANLALIQDPSSINIAPKKSGGILPIINALRCICNHGESLLASDAMRLWKNRDQLYFPEKHDHTDVGSCDNCQKLMSQLIFSDFSDHDFPCIHTICRECVVVMEDDEAGADKILCPLCDASSSKDSDLEQPDALMENVDSRDPTYRPSSKVQALLSNLRAEQSSNSNGSEEPIKR